LSSETITLDVPIRHDVDAAPAGGVLTAVSSPSLQVQVPQTGDSQSIPVEEQTVQVDCDTTPPVIQATIDGTLGNDGWYVSDVEVSWSVTDDESAIEEQEGCEAATVTDDTAGVDFSCSASSAGGPASETVT